MRKPRFGMLSCSKCGLLTALFAVSENKVLCHPSSVDSLTTSAGTEDHVSMGGWSARKALRVVEHVEQGERANLKSILTSIVNFCSHLNNRKIQIKVDTFQLSF